MRRTLTLVIVGLFMVLGLQAQYLPEQGSTALTFQIAGLGQFGVSGPFTGMTTLTPLFLDDEGLFADNGLTLPIFGIGAKAFLSDNFVLRGALGINYNSKSQDITTMDSTGADVTETHTDDLFVAAIAPGIEYHFAQSESISGYTGLLLSYTSGVKTTGPNDNQESSISSSLMVGPLLGAEFFPWDNVSFGIEYILGLSSISTSKKVGDVESDGPSYLNIQTGNFAVRGSLYIN